MRSRGLLLFAIIFCHLVSSGKLFAEQSEAPGPQTARQALLEMFFSKSSGTFMKHLPAATRAVLEKASTSAGVDRYAMLSGQWQSQLKHLQTFETGSVLLTTEDPKTSAKTEVIVENDALRGDNDDIEVTFQTYKNGTPKRTPFMPHITFAMKIESGVWKLNEVSLTVHLPLADPDLLKTISDAAKAQPLRASASPVSPPGFTPAAHIAGNDAAVVKAMRSIVTAEATYARTYRSVGYTCTLSDLDGFGSGEPNPHQAMLINAGLAGGRRYGYEFRLSQCGGTPASSFALTAAPSGSGFGQRAYCADQTGAVRYSADGNPASCFASGTPAP